MIYGYMLNNDIKTQNQIEIIIYTKLKQFSINEALTAINEEGGSDRLKLYLSKLKRDVILFIRSADSGGGSAGNVSGHMDSPTIKIKGEESNIGGGKEGLPILIPKSKEQDPIPTITISKKQEKELYKNYKEVFTFVSNNNKTLSDIWFCTDSNVFKELINKLLQDNAPALHK